MKKNIKYLIVFVIITVIIILSYSYKIYAATTPCKHTTKYDTVVQEPTCTQEGWVQTRCAKCGILLNQYSIGKNPGNHTGEAIEELVEQGTCSTFPKYKKIWTCCGAEEIFEKEMYDYSNHVHKRFIEEKYQYRAEYVNGELVIKKYLIKTYKCDVEKDAEGKEGCDAEYSEEIDLGITNDYVMPDAPEDTSGGVNGGAWDYRAYSYWKHTDAWNNGHEEFLCQRFGGTEESVTPNGSNDTLTYSEKLNLLLCKWKLGSLRFTPNIIHINHEAVSGKFSKRWPSTAVDGIIYQAKNKAMSLLEEADYWKATTAVKTPIYQNYRGISYPIPNNPPGTWQGTYPSWTYYGKVYCETPEWSLAGAKQENNNRVAYIASSGPQFSPTGSKFNLNQGNHVACKSDVADDQLIQDALWKDLGGFNEGSYYKTDTTDANELYNEAGDYEQFYNNYVSNGYESHVSKDNSEARVVVNRNDNDTKESYYIVGPFSVTYPNDKRFSYIEDMFLIAKNEETNSEITLRNFSMITANDGAYPESGEKFWVKFKAEEAGYPTSVEFKMSFAYLASCGCEYEVYNGIGKVKQIVGTVTVEDTNDIDYEVTKDQGVDTDGDGRDDDTIQVHDYYVYKQQAFFSTRSEKIGEYIAQKLAMLKTRERQWKKYTISVSEKMDLTMELGGTVWEDTKGGKETENDNIYDSSKSINDQTDRPIPGTIVTLYRKDGTIAQLTKDNNPNNDAEEQIQNPTVTDNDGKYKFTGINSMYQYYVQFTYNSQYYEPVEYVGPYDDTNGWDKGNWKINSNGTDVILERENINARFASIGSSPENYQGAAGYNETFTKMQLMGYTLQEDGKYRKTREAVVDSHLVCSNTESNHEHTGQCYDTFGNLIIQTSNDETTKKMIQYVKDCQLNSYTGKDVVNGNNSTRNNDLYPIFNEFVIDENTMQTYHNTRILADKKLISTPIKFLYENDANLYINQGYTQRRTADLALHKDIDNIHVKINGKQQTYVYDTRTKDDNVSVSNSDGTKKGDTTWDMNIRLADGYYNAQYSREFYQSDYEYKIDDYKGKADAYGKTQDDELKVYITYKLTIKNQAQSVRARIDEIIDYYDEDLVFDTSDEYIINNSYMKTRMDGKTYTYGIKASDKSRYNNTTMTQIDGYDNLYVQLDGDVYMKTGQTVYVYLTFRVKKDGNRNVLLDEKDWKLDGNSNIISTPIGVGKENIAEINGYSTIYGDGTTVPNVGDVSGKPAGIVDRDSNPGNIKATDVPKDGKVNYNNLEDDTDKSPNVRLKLATTQDENNRLLDGIVWEDLRTVTNDMQYTTVANGIMDNGETGINGVTVQLVELMENGTEYIWKQFSTGQGSYEPIINKLGLATTVNDNTVGKYAFKSYPAGNYIVRFIYGDTIKTVLPNSQTDITKLVGKVGENAKSYTGQDYKSTSYQVGIPNGKAFTFRNAQILSNDVTKYTSNESGKFYYDVTASDTNANVSDAKDIMKDDNANVENGRQNATLNSREDVENYSKSNVTNHIAEVLASQEQLQEYYKNDKDKVNSLLDELMTKTAMTAETGVINTEIEKDTQTTTNQTVNNVITYKVQNVNLGLEERPKAQLAINKEVTNVKLTLADGSTLFDAKQSATNVLWKDHKKYDLGYTKNYVLNTDKYGSIENIRKKNATDVRFGLIQLSMDEELMHGATIKISYKVTVSNVGEVDYDDDMFYYTGTALDVSKVVETQANQVIDYVANNLQFDGSDVDNNAWKVITRNDLINNGLVNSKLENEVEKYNTIITTKSDSNSNIAKTSLQPEIYNKDKSEVSDKLVLTQLITSENSTDDLTYRNIVEIVKTSNTVGRRNQYSVVGNQNPTQEPQELDSDISEAVRILPPFGANITYIIIAIVTMVSAIVVVGGIIFIKKKVLK